MKMDTIDMGTLFAGLNDYLSAIVRAETPDELTEASLGRVLFNFNFMEDRFRSPLLGKNSILNYRGIAEKLKASDSPQLKRVWDFLNRECKDKIKDPSIQKSYRNLLPAAFNEILNRVDFYDRGSFWHIKPDGWRKRVDRKWVGDSGKN